jgi:dTDP-4-dehydrorhamnose reductase
VPFVHISTDYVFDGGGDAPFAPDAPTAPLGAYGRTKLAGERAVAEVANPAGWAVLRTSWVVSAHGANFVLTMLRLGAERPELRVVEDQVGGPTPAADIAAACARIAGALAGDASLSGVYHFSGAPDASWAELARAVMDGAALPARVVGIPSTAYPTPARRPLNSRLDCTATEAAFGLPRPDWREGVRRILAERGAPKETRSA